MKYSRILLKLSGESLGGPGGQGLDATVLQAFAKEIKPLIAAQVQVAVVIGGGNIYRGISGLEKGMDRVKGDQMGMLATVINSIALAQACRAEGMEATVFTATPMLAFAKYFSRDEVVTHLQQGHVVFLAGGTGNPFFTTDSAGALRAVEIQANALLKGTRVDGVYTADPEKDPQAQRFDTITFNQVLERKLRIMDQTAFTLCSENNLPIVVFNMNQPGALAQLVLEGNTSVGTIIK